MARIKCGNNSVTQSKPQQTAKRHHYIPEFYQKKWINGEKGQLFVYQRHNGHVHCRRKSPGATGYVERLYTMDEVSPEEAQIIETEYMSPVDSLAANARDALIDRRPLTRKERGAWVQFILSLMMRMPEELALYKTSYRGQFLKYRPLLENHYLEARESGQPESYDEYLKQIGPGGIEKQMMRLFLQMITNEKLAAQVSNMVWTAIDMRKANYKLMTSDRPLVIPYGLGQDHAYIAMPLSPETLFVAVNDKEIALRQMAEAGLSKLAAHVNTHVVGNAHKYVYAYDKTQTRFVDNRMGNLPRWSLVQRMLDKFERDEARVSASNLQANRMPDMD